MRRRQWKATALAELVGRLQKAVPGLELDWNHKTRVAFTHPRLTRTLGKITTASHKGLKVEISGGLNRFTPAKIKGLGVEPHVKRMGNRDVITFSLRELQDVDTRQLALVLREVRANAGLTVAF